MRRLLLLLLLFASAHADYWPAHLWADGRAGTWRHGGGAGIFVPYLQAGNNMFFLQGYAGRFRNAWVGSAGAGYRQMLAKDLAWGINGFVDYGYSDAKVSWVQGSFGAELMGDSWEMRLNVYVPELGAQLISEEVTPVVTLDGVDLTTTVTTRRREEKARWGFDTEAGLGICIGQGSLWGYLGYYRFANKGLATFQGPQARLEYRFDLPMDWGLIELTVAGEYTHDNLFGSKAGGYISLRLPLYCQTSYGCYPRTSVCRRIANKVMRMNGFVLRDFTDINVATSTRQLLFVANVGAPAAGTQTDPTTLNDAVGRASVNDIMFMLQDDGNIPIDGATGAPGATLTLVRGQSVLGFDNQSSVTIDFGSGAELTITDLTGAGRAILVQGTDQDAIVMADTTIIDGIGIEMGSPGAGPISMITGTNISNIAIQNNILTGDIFTERGIDLTGVTGNIAILNNEIVGIAGAFTAIDLSNGSSQEAQYGIEGNMLTLPASSGPGIHSTVDGTANVELAAKSNQISGGVESILLEKTGTGGRAFWVIDENTLELGLNGVKLSASGGGATLLAQVTSNKLEVSDDSGIFFDLNHGGGANTLNAEISGNNLEDVAASSGDAILIDASTSSNASDIFTIEIKENTTQGIGSANNASTLRAVGGTGKMNLTVTDNIENTPGAGVTLSDSAYAFEQAQAAGTKNTLCLTMTGNKADTRTGTETIDLDVNTDNTMNVTNLGTPATGNGLSTANNNLSVKTNSGTGLPTNVTSNCTTPTFPSD